MISFDLFSYYFMETLFYEKSVRIFKLKSNLFEILAARISNDLNLSFNPNEDFLLLLNCHFNFFLSNVLKSL